MLNSPLGRVITQIALVEVFVVGNISTVDSGCRPRIRRRVGFGTAARRLFGFGFVGDGLAALERPSAQIVVHGWDFGVLEM